MTTHDRLLAILKEPDRFFVALSGFNEMHVYDRAISLVTPVKECVQDREALTLCADLNARHRLKRLCEEIAKAERNSRPITEMESVIEGECNGLAIDRRILQQAFCAAILALGEDNEHS